MKKNKRNYLIYALMMTLFGILIYGALRFGEQFGFHQSVVSTENAFDMFRHILADNLVSKISILLFQIIVILVAVRIFSFLFKYIGQPGVIGEIVAGIVLGPSLLGYFFPEFFGVLFRPDSLDNLNLLSQIGLLLFMFVIGMELDFGILKNKMNETLVISHAGIVVPFFLGIVTSIWVYEEYASTYTSFLPFALFIGISMSITAFPVLARIIQERNMTKSQVGVLSLASAANDDVTAWCLLAIVIAIAKAGTFVSAIFTIGLTLAYILVMFLVVRPFLRKIGETYANSEVINKSFVGFIFLTLVVSSVTTEIIGIHALFGAFIAGVVMPPNLGFRKVMMEKVEDIALVFFLPLFFAYTGLHTEIGLINTPELWLVCLLFIAVSVLGKLGGCAIAARTVGENWKDSLIIGTLMNTRGLMELVALNIGYEMGVLPPPIFVILVLMALTTTFMTTPLLALVEKLFTPKVRHQVFDYKVLLSFGRPESGQILLSLASLLLGKRLDKSKVIAAHYTLGTDVNPAKAQQYERDSFKLIEREAAQLRLKVEKRYKVTDKLTQEMVQLIDEEKIDFLFLGAGQNFTLSEHESEKRPLLSRLFRLLKHPADYLPGSLLREKIESVVKQVDCSVGIFVNRGFSRPKQIFILLLDADDLFLLDYIDNLFSDNLKSVTLGFFTDGFFATPTDKEQVRVKVAGYSKTQVLFADGVERDKLLYENDTLVVMSYNACALISDHKNFYNNLPSFVVIRGNGDNTVKSV